jgi:FixJ family two-component response regulator
MKWLVESAGLTAETFHTAQDFLEAYSPQRRGCLVTDVRLPGTSGLDLLSHLQTQGMPIATIIITAYGDVSMAVRALKNGAVDFIVKPYNDQELLDSIQRAIELDVRIREQRAIQNEIQSRFARLTAREREVMDLVVVGRANKQVAAELGCSGKTVEVHRARVMDKMQATSLASLVRMSIQRHACMLDTTLPECAAPELAAAGPSATLAT